LDLTNKRVWISGASAGLGEALARYAHEAGAEVILSARSVPKLETLANELRTGPGVEVLPLDLTQPDTFPEAVEAAGPIDFLINNGGISQRSPAVDTKPEVVRRIMETNFFGHVELTRLVLPAMISRKSGHIAVTSSVVGHIGTPMRSAYAASKHALHGYYDSLRYEVAREGIEITLISPGYIHTDISRNAVTSDGSSLGTMDSGQANGMSPAAFARKAWRAIERGKAEVYIGGSELTGIYLKRYVPWLLDKIMLRRGWDGQDR